MTVVEDAEQAAQVVHRSRAVEVLARLGIAARGLVWLVLAVLAFSVVRGRSAQTDQAGALRELAQAPFGEPLLLALAVGFLGYGVYCALSAAVGHRDESGLTRARHRLTSLGKAGVYLMLCVSTVSFLARGSGGASASSRTADVMSRPGGRTAVLLAGVAVIVVGVVMAGRGLARRHAACLEDYRVPDALRMPAIVVGLVGHVGRGVVVALVGMFLARAAILFDPQQAKGLDAALQSVVEQPYGRSLLSLAVVGMLAYALWSFFESAYRDI